LNKLTAAEGKHNLDVSNSFYGRAPSNTAFRFSLLKPRRRGNEAGHGRVGVTIECAQVDSLDSAASRAPHPQIPIARGDGGADRRREQHGHLLGLALVPGGDQPLGILQHLSIGSAARSGFFFGQLPALIFHLALVESHGRIVVEWARVSMSALHPKADTNAADRRVRFGPIADIAIKLRAVNPSTETPAHWSELCLNQKLIGQAGITAAFCFLRTHS